MTQQNDLHILQLNDTLWHEWSAPDGMTMNDYEAIKTMTEAFGIRVANDQATVDAMIDNGVDPEEAWDRVTNWKNWMQACLLAAYNIGRGKQATEETEVFATYINTMNIEG